MYVFSAPVVICIQYVFKREKIKKRNKKRSCIVSNNQPTQTNSNLALLSFFRSSTIMKEIILKQLMNLNLKNK